MNKCKYCKKELIKKEFSWDICKCEKAQKDWSINMKIQEYKKCLSEAKRELNELRDCSHKS